jgi:HlyD family secretion protein
MKRALFILLVIAAVGAGAGAYYMRRNGVEVTVNTSPVTRGDIIDTVGATGTLQAVTTVQVGSQVSGTIQDLNADFNSIVRKGQVIARLDRSLLQAQVEQARANLARARADLKRSEVQLDDAQTKYTRAKELASKSLLPLSELDAAKVAVDAAQAQLVSSQAQVSQAEATLNQNQVNVEHTVITAPIDGIVIQRSVDVGQTVAASLQSPTLFVIAADLTKMQVNANIDESDVGRIRPGQVVTFRVDAYPDEQFEGEVAQIRLQPVVVQNVTTYGTIINVPNPNLKLKPGMTANLRVQIATRSNVLRVPNAAIRFRPTNDVFAALHQAPPPETPFGGGRGQRGQGQGQPSTDADVPNGKTSVPAESTSQGPTKKPGAEQAARGTGSSKAPPADESASPPPFASTQQGASTGGRQASGRGSFGGDRAEGSDTFQGGRGGGGGRERMMDRFKDMSPDEQKQFIARMKERGVDVSGFEAVSAKKPPSAGAPKQAATRSAATIDALFAPLPPVESRGRVWLYINHELKPVNLRLGITDGTNTEILSGELQPGIEVVTGVLTGTTRQTQGGAGTGNPLLPQGGRGRDGFGGFPGGGFPGGGGRGR